MNIQRLNQSSGIWERVASTGNDFAYPICIFRLHDLNTVFEFEDSNGNGLFRFILPDRDWIKRTDIR